MRHTQEPPPRINELLRVGRDASIQELCLPHALDPSATAELDGSMTRERQLRRGQTLFRQGHGLHALYVPSQGVIKTVLVDGGAEKPQVLGFHFPGELVGLDALYRREHVCTAVAAAPSRVQVLPLHRLEEAMHQVPALREAIDALIRKSLVEYEQLLAVVNQRPALERVSVFLFSLSCRLGQDSRAASELSLPLSRGDIANYLGLASETVSRAISRLQAVGILEGYGRRMRIADPQRLREWAVWGRAEEMT